MWRCDKCGFQINAPVVYPVHCRCGATTEDDRVKRRLEVCQRCDQYVSTYRCKRLDLGCGKEFRKTLDKGDCPLGRWSEEMTQHGKKTWAVGVTTCTDRLNTLLPKTLESLARAGFDKPRLFIDGLDTVPEHLKSYEVTLHKPPLRTHGNWLLAAHELFVRNPTADLYAIFQDDCLTVLNLREYLEQIEYPQNGYLNLYTFPQNEKPKQGFYLSNQLGKGAVGLVFSRNALRTILSSRHMVDRPMNEKRGWKSVDGGIVTGMKKAGWKEYVHNPSLLYHTGEKSSICNAKQQQARTFPGVDFDALTLLKPANEQPAPKVVVKDPADIRVGIAGYNADCGLGACNMQLAKYCDIHSWLVRPHGRLPSRPPSLTPNTKVLDDKRGWNVRVEEFLRDIDVLLFCESPFPNTLVPRAKALGKRIVCVPMLEWTPESGWVNDVDLFICPTRMCFHQLKDSLPCADFPWPYDTSSYPFVHRRKCEKFLYLHSTGGWNGRKGGDVVKVAKQLWPEMPLSVRSHSREDWPAGTERLPYTADPTELYRDADVLLLPHRADGIGMEALEAACSGMPIISTDGDPWSEYPAIARVRARKKTKRVKRVVPWYECLPEHLVEVCKRILDTDISDHSGEVRHIAECNRWEGRVDEFMRLVKTGEHRVALPFEPVKDNASLLEAAK